MTTPNFKNSQLGITVSTDHPSFSVGSSGILFTDGSRQLTAFTGIPSDTNTFTSSLTYNTGDRNLILNRNDGVSLTGNFDVVLHSGDNVSLLNNNLGYITGLIQDTSPKLGANLDLNSNDITGTGDFNIIGSGIITETMDNHCGFIIKSSGNTNGELHVGSCSDANGVPNAMGLRHSSMMGSNDYMICANTDGATFVSSKDTKALTLTAGGNDADTKLELRDVSGPNAGFRFNVNKSNVDLQYNGDNENNVFYIDASADSVGIGIATPSTKLHVSGIITANGGNSTNWNTAYSWGDHSTLYATTGELSSVSGHLQSQIDAGAGGSLGALSDVTLNAPVNQNDVLAYSSGGSAFVNTSLNISLIKRGSIPFGGYNDDQMGHYFYFDGSSEAVINTDGDDINFRVEGSGGTNLLFTDAGTDRVGIGNNSPTHKLDVTYADGHCVRFADSGGSGVHIGDCALGANVKFAGMKHSDYNMTTDYMIVSDGTDTYISAKDSGGSVYLRPGGNAGEGGIKISDVGAGGVSTVFNEAGSDRDIRMEGSSDVNLFRLDAGEDRIGIGTAAPVSKLDVNGTITTTSLVKSGGTSSQFLKADGSVDSTTYLSAHPNISAASSVNNSGGGFIQDITVDSNGHVTGMTSATAVISNTGLAGSAASLSAILNIVTISSGDYAGLSSKNANTLYFVL